MKRDGAAEHESGRPGSGCLSTDSRITNHESRVLLSVIIPAYNEERLIASAIASVFRSNTPMIAQGKVEIIVVDNASTDATATVAQRAGARVISEPKRQIARARNAGARDARGDCFLFLDADSEVHPEHLQRVVDLLGSGKIIGGGAIVAMEGPWDCQLFVRAWNRISKWGRMAAGSFLFCGRAAFETVGGFDERLYASEELAISNRLRKLGRAQGKQFAILSDLPVRTSNRKVVDNTRWEIWRSFFRLAIRGRNGLRNQRACEFWYPETRR